jgi:hypothetical protein
MEYITVDLLIKQIDDYDFKDIKEVILSLVHDGYRIEGLIWEYPIFGVELKKKLYAHG